MKKYYDDHENDVFRINVDNEVTGLIDLADQNRKDEDLLHSDQIQGIKIENIEEEKMQS